MGVKRMRQSVENHSDEEILNTQLKRKIIEEQTVQNGKRHRSSPEQKKEVKVEEKKLTSGAKYCGKCNKKLKLLCDFSCRCGNVYCAKHRFHDQHDCTFNYRKKALEELKKSNPKI